MMSGTSLDGMDLVAAEFWQDQNQWKFNIAGSQTIPYSKNWIQKLKTAPSLSSEDLLKLHSEYGNFIGREIIQFIRLVKFSPDLLSSHGHTIFHQPEKSFTFQLGNGGNIAATTNITTVSDFRTQDVAFGGQGAPLVPIGDKLLFSEFDYCLNLGGFSNISFEEEGKRIAFDICPVNIVLNYFAEKKGFAFDKNGELGRKGRVNNDLLNEINNIPFYSHKPPKSLGREWLEKEFISLLNQFQIDDTEKLRTIYEHVAQQISSVLKENSNVLITGGGAFNKFLIELLGNHSKAEIVIPSEQIINYKEALIFAFLGVLKFKGEINCLASVTGAKYDHSSGIVFSS